MEKEKYCSECNNLIDFKKTPVKMNLKKGILSKVLFFCSWKHMIDWTLKQTTEIGDLKPL